MLSFEAVVGDDNGTTRQRCLFVANHMSCLWQTVAACGVRPPSALWGNFPRYF